jgi:uncharacterized membrane protein YbhN (UPF0104 family)
VIDAGAEPPSTTSGRGVRVTAAALRRGLRFYSAPIGQPRARRATDVLLLVPSLIGLALLTWAYPPSTFEESFQAFVASFPGWLDPVWGFVYDLLGLWAIVLLVVAVIRRRPSVVLGGVSALVLATGLALVSARLATGHWPDLGDAIRGGSGAPTFPAMRVGQAGAVIVTVAPHLVRPLQRLGRWFFALGLVGALFAAGATLSGVLAAILVALAAAAAVRLAFGTSAGRPSLPDIRSALAELGVAAEQLETAERQVAGVFAVRAVDANGLDLLVKIYGRDAYDNQLLAKFWRTLWYKDGGPTIGLSRGQSAEHEAFVTLLARNAGVPTQAVVTAGATAEGDALLVLRGVAKPLGACSLDELDDERLGQAWRTILLLGDANIAHLGIDTATVAVLGDEVGLVDFAGATVAPAADQLLTDRAQLLATTAVVAGGERASAAALTALGADGAASLLPFLQAPALGTRLRKSVKAAGIDIDELRAHVAEAVVAQPPELVKLRRVTWWTVIQAGLLVLAAGAVVTAASNVDWDELRSDLADASWGWIAFGFILAQVPRVTQAVAMLGAIAARLPFGPVYLKELATCYLNLAMPSSIARMAVSIRFFQCQGLPGAAAVTAGAIDSLANNVVQAMILILLLLFGQSSLSINLSSPSDDSSNLIWILLGLLVLTVLVVALVGRVRRAIVGRLRVWWPQVRTAVGALRASNKLLLLIGGNVATEVLFSISLGLFAEGLGYHISLTDLLLINESVALLSSFIPVPGGIGVVEFGLTTGLTAAGMPTESALAAVLLYRLATFYLPPVWGFFAFRWLQKNHYL